MLDVVYVKQAVAMVLYHSMRNLNIVNCVHCGQCTVSYGCYVADCEKPIEVRDEKFEYI